METNHKSTLMVLAALALILLVFSPAATAQGPAPTLSIETLKPPTSVIKPEIGTGALTFKVKYAIQSQAQTPIGAVASNAVVTLTPTCENPNVLIQGPTTYILTIAPGTTTSSADVSFAVTIGRQAPGLAFLKCSVGAQAGEVQSAGLPKSNSASTGPFTVEADYFPYIQAKVTSATLDAGPQKPIPFAIVIDNFGNAQTQVTFALASKPADNWNNIILPPPLTLDSPNGGGSKTQDTATFTVNTPYKNGWNNAEQAYTLTLTPIAALDNSKTGTPMSVSMFSRSRGIYVPGPEPMLLVAAVLGAALLAKMVRQDD